MLELWEDTKGPLKGIKYFRGRWLFYPHHLPADHKEVKRKRTGLELRQVYEQCDAAANNDENVLASVRSLQRVLCCWKDSRNRVPSDEERQSAHAWFDSAWDDERREVVPLSACVDKAGSGACRHAAARFMRFDAAREHPQHASRSSVLSKSSSRLRSLQPRVRLLVVPAWPPAQLLPGHLSRCIKWRQLPRCRKCPLLLPQSRSPVQRRKQRPKLRSRVPLRALLLRPRRSQQLPQQPCLFASRKLCTKAALRQPRWLPPLAKLQHPVLVLQQLLRNALRRLW